MTLMYRIESTAKKLYYRSIDDSTVHCNRFPSWDEMSEMNKKEWRDRARVFEEGFIHDISEFGDLMTLEEFIESVDNGSLIDYDGFGQPVYNGKMSHISVYPSDYELLLPKETTHIIWFNK